MAKKTKKLTYKDDFEMLYLRHEYMRRIDVKNIDTSLIEKNAGIVHTTGKIMFGKYKHVFTQVGFTQEDVIVIANIYMLYYMALYSIKTQPDQLDKVIKRRSQSTPPSEVDRIDRNRLINFLRQKLGHAATLSARKARDIVVGADKKGVFAATANAQDVDKELIMENPKKYGYRKITAKEFKDAQKQARLAGSKELKDAQGFLILKVETPNIGISEYDYGLLTESNKGEFYNSPDQDLENFEEEIILEHRKNYFNALDQEGKVAVLNKFIDANSKNKRLRKEVRLAKKMLNKDCGIML